MRAAADLVRVRVRARVLGFGFGFGSGSGLGVGLDGRVQQPTNTKPRDHLVGVRGRLGVSG